MKYRVYDDTTFDRVYAMGFIQASAVDLVQHDGVWMESPKIIVFDSFEYRWSSIMKTYLNITHP